MTEKARKPSPPVTIFLIVLTLIMAVIAQCTTDVPQTSTPRPTSTSGVIVTPTSPSTGGVTSIPIGNGFGAQKGFWQVFFTDPPPAGVAHATSGGIDEPVAQAIDSVRNTLDIAAFEWDNARITKAVLDAKKRGVNVRMVADNEHTIDDIGSTMQQMLDAGIPVVFDQRSAFMHNKFMIMDSTTVWMGSTNWTLNDVYRNNNNILALRSRRAVETYQAEFNEMFSGIFGPRNSQPNNVAFQQDGIIVRILFSPEDPVVDAITSELVAASSEIKFMAFSFTLDEIGDTLLEMANQGVQVEGIFETRGSETSFSEMPRLKCAGLDVRQDGNPRTMHHKVFIIDRERVITGSFNFSSNATNSNDENMVIVYDPDLAEQYLAEYERVKSQSRVPPNITCN